MRDVITTSEPSWIAPLSGLSSRQFGKLITALQSEAADPVREGRPWSLPLEERVLLIAAYWRANLTLRQLAPLFDISKSAADRIVDHLGRRSRSSHASRSVWTPYSLWTAHSSRSAITRWPSSRRTTGAPPTTRSSSTPAQGSSSPSAGHCQATAITARRGNCSAPWPLGNTTFIADGGYRGTCLAIPHSGERGQVELPRWKLTMGSPHHGQDVPDTMRTRLGRRHLRPDGVHCGAQQRCATGRSHVPSPGPAEAAGGPVRLAGPRLGVDLLSAWLHARCATYRALKACMARTGRCASASGKPLGAVHRATERRFVG
ncbi:Helix-turn-helix of DDE superfamily endonuclease [Streptomyces sp. 2323.1]|nr:Helix-turn-helix of DDE superfamily endonuclease [Streptomyces sp. 2323.1]